MPRQIDLLGKTFGRLTVLNRAAEKSIHGILWHCRCECGNERVIRSDSLRSGATSSCGCLSAELTNKRNSLEFPWLVSRNVLVRDYKAGATDRGLSFSLTDEQCHELFEGTCVYCGVVPDNTINHYMNKDGSVRDYMSLNVSRDLTEATYRYNGIDRVDPAKGYEPENCVSCCKICNRAKGSLSKEEFLAWASRLHQFQNSI